MDECCKEHMHSCRPKCERRCVCEFTERFRVYDVCCREVVKVCPECGYEYAAHHHMCPRCKGHHGHYYGGYGHMGYGYEHCYDRNMEKSKET